MKTISYRLWERPEEWPYELPGYVFLARACEQIGQLRSDWNGVRDSRTRKEVLESIREHCAYGRLLAFALAYRGELKPIPAPHWFNSDCWEWFPDCTITNFAIYGAGIHPLAGVAHFPLYISENSLTGVLKALRTPAKGPPDRSPKKSPSTNTLLEWASPIFKAVEQHERPVFTRDEFERMAREKFGDISTTKVRGEVWDKRPSIFPRRASKGT